MTGSMILIVVPILGAAESLSSCDENLSFDAFRDVTACGSRPKLALELPRAASGANDPDLRVLKDPVNLGALFSFSCSLSTDGLTLNLFLYIIF